jgi:hypothetical protein
MFLVSVTECQLLCNKNQIWSWHCWPPPGKAWATNRHFHYTHQQSATWMMQDGVVHVKSESAAADQQPLQINQPPPRPILSAQPTTNSGTSDTATVLKEAPAETRIALLLTTAYILATPQRPHPQPGSDPAAHVSGHDRLQAGNRSISTQPGARTRRRTVRTASFQETRPAGTGSS